MSYRTNLPHKSILEAMNSMRPKEIVEVRANDNDSAVSELEEAQSLLRQAVRHIEQAIDYSDGKNDFELGADRVVTAINNLRGSNDMGFEGAGQSIQELINRLTGTGWEEDEQGYDESEQGDDFY